MSANIITLSDSSFDETVKSSESPVLVDFWAEWCGPCKMISPILEEIAAEQEGRLQVAKLNVDENLESARRFEVMSIPTMILFKDGEAQHRIVGAKGKGQLTQELEAFL
jgi:thioredoxin 1